MIQNPFPGPQPFRATDRARFYGREDLSRRLEGSILAHRAVVVYGPSGSGKSSLIQASVLPNLRDTEDVRVVYLDGWPPGEDPTHWLAMAMHSELKHGVLPDDVVPAEALLSSVKRAVRGSSRMLIISIDQLEQLFYPDRDPQKTREFFDCVNEILDLPLRTLRVVMSLREDYLGVFRDRLRDHRRVLGRGFRVGPLTVGELTESMCKTAAVGVPVQTWPYEETLAIMMQVRIPGQGESDEAEAQAAYGQIVCRALFQDRAAGADLISKTPKGVRTEAILEKYLETTLADLGPLREQAERLLTEQLVSGDGGRTLRTEKELQRYFSAQDLSPILTALEGSSILHAASHQGSRYFEIGHDWLARKVFEKRQIRERELIERRREEEQAAALAKVRRERRNLVIIAAALLAGIVGTIIAAIWIWTSKRKAEEAEASAKKAAIVAQRKEIDARDASILAGVRELSSRGKLTWAMKLLPEVQLPAYRRGWVALASDLLAGNVLLSTLTGHTASVTNAVFSPDGKLILTSSVDGTARIWDIEGKAAPVVLSGHTDALVLANFSHDGKSVLTASKDGTARVFDLAGKTEPLVLTGATGPLTYAEFSPDDKRVVTASEDGFVRIHSVEENSTTLKVQGGKKAVLCARFHPDGQRVFFSTHQEENVQVWDGKPNSKPKEIGSHDGPVVYFAISSQGTHLITASLDGDAALWDIQGKQPKIVTTIEHDGPVHHAAFSADGKFVATASSDRTARVARVDGSAAPIVLSGHTQGVTHVEFDSSGYFLATASQDFTGRIFRVQGGVSLVLRGHDAAVHSIAFQPHGTMVVTAAGDGTDRSPDETAKIWDGAVAAHLGLGTRGPKAFHAAAGSFVTESLVTVHDDGSARMITRDHVENPIVLPGPGSWVSSVAFSNDGHSIVTAAFDNKIRLYSLEKPLEPTILGSHKSEAGFALFSPDGQKVLSGGDDKLAIVWSVDRKTGPIELKGHEDWLTAGAWSPDGKRVVTTSFDHTARIWNANGEGEPQIFAGHEAEILAVAFFPDGQRIATASADHTARIWQSGKPTIILQHEAPVTHIGVSPDNHLIVTYAADHLIRIWRTDGISAAPPIELESPAAIRLLGFISSNDNIVVFDEEGTLRTSTVDVGALRTAIINANAECLPSSIRVLYLGESFATANERFASCRREPQKMPWFGDIDKELLMVGEQEILQTPARVVSSPLLKDLGIDFVRNKIVVLPTDADVEVDGILTARRQGVIELVGKIGQPRKLLVQRGAKHRLFEITIGPGGSTPPRIDLNDQLPESSRPRGPDKPAVTDHNPTLPNDMQ